MPQDQQIETLRREWEASRDKYKEALRQKRDAMDGEIQEKEKQLEAEQNAGQRKTLLETLKHMRDERESLNENIRIINASDVVKFARGRDKIVSLLTGQTPA